MTVTFTKHARERMEEREISMAEVRGVLQYGAPAWAKHGKHPAWKVDPESIPEKWLGVLDSIRVVCTSDYRIVTVYRATKRMVLSLGGASVLIRSN